MFADLGVEKLLVLALIALFVLGPERLPAAVGWTVQAVRRVRQLAEDTQRSLQRDLGPEVDELRQPLQDLREPLEQLRDLRGPSRALGRYLITAVDPSLPENPAHASTPWPDPSRTESIDDTVPGPNAQLLAPLDPDTT